MRRTALWLMVLVFCPLLGAGTGWLWWMGRGSGDDTVLPTRHVLPSLTASARPSRTPMATITATVTPTGTATPTFTETATATATDTATLSTHVLNISAQSSESSDATTPGQLSAVTLIAELPPQFEPLPDATRAAPPFVGWYRFESDFPSVIYTPLWERRQAHEASRGQYHRTDVVGAVARFIFEGQGISLRYVAATNMGWMDITIDGQVIDALDAYASELRYATSPTYIVGSGTHVLEIRHTGRKNPASSGTVIALDAIQVFRGSPDLLVMTPYLSTITPTPSPQPIVVEQLADPSRLRPTPTPPAAYQMQVMVVIAYDENGNRAVEPAEGLIGISVRLVEIRSNRVLAQTLTDAAGLAQLSVTTTTAIRVIVPYFGKTWDVPPQRANGPTRFTLLLTPGNQPGLIP